MVTACVGAPLAGQAFTSAPQEEKAAANEDEGHLYEEEEEEELEEPIKCSAVHTLERDMPDFDYSSLVDELRDLILEHSQANPGLYSQQDVTKCKEDTWFLSRFLLRNKLDIQDSLEMLKKAMRFNHESLSNSLRREDFPAEFYQLGGVFCYEPDRKGNKMLYMRTKVHRKTPEIVEVIHAFIYFNIRLLDEEAGGKGISLVIDCSGAGLQNADMDLLLFIVSTLKNYFPKGLSYLLVHELPWILKPFWHIAKAWVAEEHRQLVKFSDSKTIFEYVERCNLPDFMGGTCKRDYRAVPENCVSLDQAAKLWGVDKQTVNRVLDKFADNLPEETVRRVRETINNTDDKPLDEEQPPAQQPPLPPPQVIATN